MPPAAAVTYVRCRTGFRLADGRTVKGGEVVRADDAVVKLCPDAFEPLDEVVEAATRAPGERRLLPPDRSATRKRVAKKAGS